MIKKYYFFILLFVFAAPMKCLADKLDGFPNESGREKELATLVGEAYVWNHYWYNDWGKDFEKVFKVGRKEKIGVCLIDNKMKEEKGYGIFFDKLPAELFFYKQNNSWYAPDVSCDYIDERTSKKQNIKDYIDFKAKQSAPIKEFSVFFDKEVLNVLNFGPFNGEKRKFVKEIFLDRILKGSDLEFIQKNEENSKKGILIKVGNFNFNYPIFYYYVEGLNDDEGIPYLGFVNFDTETRKVFQDDLISGEVQPIKRKYKNALKRIDQTGLTLRYMNGRFEDD